MKSNTHLALALLLLPSACDALMAREPSAAFSPDGHTFALLEHKEVRVWDVVTGKEGNKIRLNVAAGEVPERVGYTAKGDMLILLVRAKDIDPRRPASACVWNLISGKRSPFIKILDGDMAVSPTGDILANDIGLWEVATGKKLCAVARPHGLVCDITFSPDGKTVLYRITESLAQDFALLFLADTATGKQVLQIGEIDLEKNRAECRLAYDPRFSADGNWLAFGEADQPKLHLWDMSRRKAVHRIPLRDFERLIGFSRDGRTLVTWHQASGVLHLWETLTGMERHKVTIGGSIKSVLLSPEGYTAALIKGNAVKFRGLKD